MGLVPVRDVDVYPALELAFATGQAFLAHYEPADGGGTFTWEGGPDDDIPDLAPGAMLSLTLRFADRGVEFHVHASLLEAQADPPRLKLAFLPEEKTREELVRGCAQGDALPYQRRRHSRVACRVPVRVETGRLSYETTATNLSDWGVHLALDVPLQPDSLVFLTLDFPDRLRLFAQGRVRSVIPAGPQRGVSVEFVFDSPKTREAMSDQVKALAQRG
jgi:hypothetical protein